MKVSGEWLRKDDTANTAGFAKEASPMSREYIACQISKERTEDEVGGDSPLRKVKVPHHLVFHCVCRKSQVTQHYLDF